MNNIEIRFGVPENQRVKVAEILYDTFEHEFKTFFGDRNKFVAFASDGLRDDRTVVAIKDGIVVGVAGLEWEGTNFLDANFHQTVKVFGLRTLRILLFESLFRFTKAAKNELLVDGLAVSAGEQKKGIGRRLLNAAIDYARSNRFCRVKIEVKETNKDAQRLYERVGFKQFNSKKILYPFNRILGFESVTEMSITL